MLADPRLGPAAVGRLEQHVERAVEFRLGGFDVPLFELFLAGFESVRSEVAIDGIEDRTRRARPSGLDGALARRSRSDQPVATARKQGATERGQRTALPERACNMAEAVLSRLNSSGVVNNKSSRLSSCTL